MFHTYMQDYTFDQFHQCIDLDDYTEYSKTREKDHL